MNGWSLQGSDVTLTLVCAKQEDGSELAKTQVFSSQLFLYSLAQSSIRDVNDGY